MERKLLLAVLRHASYVSAKNDTGHVARGFICHHVS